MMHVLNGKWQSDRYPTAPADTVPMDLTDPRFQDLVWAYAERWRTEDPAFTDELQAHLRSHGYGKRVYLCGPINGRSDDDCKNWREQAKDVLSNTIDPMARDYRGRELEPGIAKEIVENDKIDIQSCDVMLVMFDKPSVGTSMEVFYAHQLGKDIHVVDISDRPLSPWMLYHATAVHKSLADALNAIK